MIGKIARVPLREVWRHEAHDFSDWLQQNLDVLNDALGTQLTTAEREQAAGNFSVDLVAEDASGSAVIIENQLERSDHDHLGKLITYLTAYEAKTAIWIVAEPRPEHTRAIAWLNETTSAAFYLVKAEAIKIHDSPPAPLFTVIVGPSAEARVVGEAKRDLASRHHERFDFWTRFLDFAKTRSKLHANISPSYQTWIGAGAGRAGLVFNYVANQHDARAELYIDRGRDSDEINGRIFDELATHKSEIEALFGGELEWQRLEGRRACRITSTIPFLGYRDAERFDELAAGLVDRMQRLERSLSPFIKALSI